MLGISKHHEVTESGRQTELSHLLEKITNLFEWLWSDLSCFWKENFRCSKSVVTTAAGGPSISAMLIPNLCDGEPFTHDFTPSSG
ncbi:hypothetical protein Leryth_014389 [Lithospermum erythrorhizon]|nr:hypothetical protein Leryth_014389 [Lithospermum erythrorhizon]